MPNIHFLVRVWISAAKRVQFSPRSDFLHWLIRQNNNLLLILCQTNRQCPENCKLSDQYHPSFFRASQATFLMKYTHQRILLNVWVRYDNNSQWIHGSCLLICFCSAAMGQSPVSTRIYSAPSRLTTIDAWWRHQMETFSALLDICAGIHRSPVNSPHKGQWRGALMFS